jgi:hypothetical protein
MLTLIDGEFVEVVREKAYPGVLSICCSSEAVAERFSRESGTLAEPIEVGGRDLPWIIHVEADSCGKTFSGLRYWKDIEEVETFTPAPKAWGVAYILQSGEREDGSFWGEYDYCWPEEIGRRLDYLRAEEDLLDGSELVPVPLWHLPAELTGAPRVWASADGDDELEVEDDEDE